MRLFWILLAIALLLATDIALQAVTLCKSRGSGVHMVGRTAPGLKWESVGAHQNQVYVDSIGVWVDTPSVWVTPPPRDRRWYDPPVCPPGVRVAEFHGLRTWPWIGFYCDGGAVPECPEDGWKLKRWKVDRDVFKSGLLFTCADGR